MKLYCFNLVTLYDINLVGNKKDIAVGDGIRTAGLEVLGQVALRKVSKDHAAQMISGS